MLTSTGLNYLVQQSHPDWIGLSPELLEQGRCSRSGQRFLAHRCKALFINHEESSSLCNETLRNKTDKSSLEWILRISAKQWHRFAIEISAHCYAPIIKQTIAREEVQGLKSMLGEPLYREVLCSSGKMIIHPESTALERSVQSLTEAHLLSHGAALIMDHLKKRDEYASEYVACTFPPSNLGSPTCRIDEPHFEKRLQHCIEATEDSEKEQP